MSRNDAKETEIAKRAASRSTAHRFVTLDSRKFGLCAYMAQRRTWSPPSRRTRPDPIPESDPSEVEVEGDT